MGRELRRKDAKKNGKSLQRTNETNIEMNQLFKKYLKVFLIIVILLVLIYFFLAVFVTKEISFSKDYSDNGTLDYASNVANPILAKNAFRQKEADYYVYFFDFENSDGDIANAINSKLGEEKIYRVNTADSLNGNYVGESGNPNVTDISDLMVVNPTIIRVTDGQVSLYLDGKDAILSYLG